jgi:hypothetical protein
MITSKRFEITRENLKFSDYIIIGLIGLLSLAESSHGSFQKLNPVLWRKTERPITTGLNRIVLTAKYESPCIIFRDSEDQNLVSANYFAWCEKLLKTNFIEPIENFCDSPSKRFDTSISFNRQKRLAFAPVALTFIFALVVTTTIAIYSETKIEIKKANERVDEIQKKQEQTLEVFESFKDNQKVIKKILEKLQKEIDMLKDTDQSFSNSFRSYQESRPRIVQYVSTLASRLLMVKDKLSYIGKNWKKGVVDEKMFDVFNFTLPCGTNCTLDSAEPRFCHLDEKKNLISIVFDVKGINPNLLIMNVDPFTFYHRKNNGTFICSVQYFGPKSVIYDVQTDCVVPLPPNQEPLYNFVFSPSDETCKTLSSENVTLKYWKNTGCENKQSIAVEDILQLKPMGDQNYIYCDSFYIYVYDRLIACPSFVFSLPATTKFRVGHIAYEANLLQVESNIKFAPSLTQRINFQIMPSLHTFDFDKLSKEVKEDIKSINTEIQIPKNESSGFIEKSDLFISVLIIIILLALGIFIIYKFKNAIANRLRKNLAKDTLTSHVSENIEESPLTNKRITKFAQ